MDCGQRSRQGLLKHDQTCPAALTLERVTDDDREWFEARPDASHRCRMVSDAERREWADRSGRPVPTDALIHVQQIKPGMRSRALYILGGGPPVPERMGGVWGHVDVLDGTWLGEPETSPVRHRFIHAEDPSGMEVWVVNLPNEMPTPTMNAELDGFIMLAPGSDLPVLF